MSKAKFDKAVSIVQSLPKEGPIQPTQEEQLFVRTHVLSSSPPGVTDARLFVFCLCLCICNIAAGSFTSTTSRVSAISRRHRGVAHII